VEKVQSQKTDTLNERMAWDEKQKFEKETKAQQQEIASRKPPKETIYAITVADAGKPGLPPPVQFVKASPGSTPAATPGPDYVAVYPPNAINTSYSTNSIAPDPVLEESERILHDYISLWPLGQNDIARHE